MLLKHPTNGRIVDVKGARATTLRNRGYVEVTEEERAADVRAAAGPPSAVQPQPPIDTRENPPEPAVDGRPEYEPDSPIDTRPPNPLGPTSDSVAEADGAGLEEKREAAGRESGADDGDQLEPPAKSANKPEWVAFAESQGVENADELTKDQLIDRVGA